MSQDDATYSAADHILADAQRQLKRHGLATRKWLRSGTLTPLEAIHYAFTGKRRQPTPTLTYQHVVRAFALAAVGHISTDPVADIDRWAREKGRALLDVLRVFESARQLIPSVPRPWGPES